MELAEWVAFDSIEPIGERRADLRAATIVQAVLSPWTKKNRIPKIKDCILNFELPKKMSGKAIMDVFRKATGIYKEDEQDGDD